MVCRPFGHVRSVQSYAQIPAMLSREEYLARMQTMRASAALLFLDERGRLLVLRTNYREHWVIPGGAVDPGESPLDAGLRETREEIGLAVGPCPLRCVEYSLARATGELPMLHFLFEGPRLKHDDLSSINLGEDEIEEWRLLEPDAALELLGARERRRVGPALEAIRTCSTIYLDPER
jgi:8-oxo-dGTP diphosphatase